MQTLQHEELFPTFQHLPKEMIFERELLSRGYNRLARISRSISLMIQLVLLASTYDPDRMSSFDTVAR